jgi:hypothetical protein
VRGAASSSEHVFRNKRADRVAQAWRAIFSSVFMSLEKMHAAL